MSIIVSDLSYHYFNQLPLFEHINFSVPSGRKVAVVGNNGTGKSTLLKLLAGKLFPLMGSIQTSSNPYYIPQQIGMEGQSISEALNVSEKIESLHAIYEGSGELIHYEKLADDWDIEARCRAALEYWNLSHLDLNVCMDTLSGGERTKILLSGWMIHKPSIVLLDEPTNHLDGTSRQKLYDYIRDCKATVIIVSHDITLLNRLDTTYELSGKGMKLYGGDYDFYKKQKELEENALEQQVEAERTTLRLARRKAQEVKERQEKRVNQGEKNKDQLSRSMRKKAKDQGEATDKKLQEKHSDLIAQNVQRLENLRQRQAVNFELKIDLEHTSLHKGKLLIAAENLNFQYLLDHPLWNSPLNWEIHSGERIHLTGDNGTGKTTLVRLLLGELLPTMGGVRKADFSYLYLDQEYRQANVAMTVLELAQKYNTRHFQDHEIKLRLNRALFPQDMWDKNCKTLSGGERMRLCLCCMMLSNQVPDLFILDEPTNNLDLSSLLILTETMKDYNGTLLIISHDLNFVKEVSVTKTIDLK